MDRAALRTGHLKDGPSLVLRTAPCLLAVPEEVLLEEQAQPDDDLDERLGVQELDAAEEAARLALVFIPPWSTYPLS